MGVSPPQSSAKSIIVVEWRDTGDGGASSGSGSGSGSGSVVSADFSLSRVQSAGRGTISTIVSF